MTALLAVVAIGSVFAFMYWLYETGERTSVAVVPVREEAATDTVFAPVPPTQWATFGTEPDSYVGMRLRLDSVQVASRLGNQAFWTQLPNQTPFLVRLDSGVVASGLTVAGGDVLRVLGTVHRMTDSVLRDWQRQGVLADASQRAEAEFATSFLQVDRAERRRATGVP
ncbi:MAG: hypothetical protein HY701_07695 [Gemmatimonadetes bacterium]|nr:hypothetical protein [Gemmatimonadota bacterium]